VNIIKYRTSVSLWSGCYVGLEANVE